MDELGGGQVGRLALGCLPPLPLGLGTGGGASSGASVPGLGTGGLSLMGRG